MDLVRPLSGEYAEYLRDESRCVGSAEEISFPRTEDELRDALLDGYEKNVKLTLQGARTGLAAAAVPDSGRVINLMRLNRVLGMRKEGERYYLRVQPGVVLSQLRKMIGQKQFDTGGWSESSLKTYDDFMQAPAYFFTPDPTEATASIGGMAACNASGAISFRYGPMRRHVAGLRVLLCNGDSLTLRRGEAMARGRGLTLRTDGGRKLELRLPDLRMPQTKNASGYYIEDDMDVVDLFVGSDGTLGVLSEIELSLLPKPGVIWGISCFFREDGQVVPFVERARRELLSAAAIEYFGPNALEILRGQKREHAAFSRLPEIDRAFRHCIFIELHGEDPQALQGELFRIGGFMAKLGADEGDTWVARTEADRDQLTFLRHAIPESVNSIIDRRKQADPAITKLGTDMAVPDDCLAAMLNAYRTMLEQENLEYAIWGHMGDNHLHVNILAHSGEEMARGKVLYGKWAAMASEMGGSVSAEHGVGKLKAPYLLAMYGEEHIRQMESLKRAFDPKGLLGAGNLFTLTGGEAAP